MQQTEWNINARLICENEEIVQLARGSLWTFFGLKQSFAFFFDFANRK